MFTRIVVGAAETDAARKAIDTAIDLARLAGAELHLVLAFDPYLDRIEPETLPGSAHATRLPRVDRRLDRRPHHPGASGGRRSGRGDPGGGPRRRRRPDRRRQQGHAGPGPHPRQRHQHREPPRPLLGADRLHHLTDATLDGPTRAGVGRTVAGRGGSAAGVGPAGAAEHVATGARARCVEPATSRSMSACSWVGDPGRVERVDVLGEAVDDRLVLALERAEQPVPDDEDAAVVAVEVLAVAAVVHPVVRRRVEHLLERAERAGSCRCGSSTGRAG